MLTRKGKTSEFVRCDSFGNYIAPVSSSREYDLALRERIPYRSKKILREVGTGGRITYYRRKLR